MGYPNTLITDNTPGVDIYPPQPGQAFGTNTGTPTGPANPNHTTWMQRIADEMVAVQNQLGLPANPAAGSVLANLSSKLGAAPNDGKVYVQQSGVWTPKTYIADAPTDGQQYGRKSGSWAVITGGGGGGGSSQAISRLFIFGDSYGANSAPGSGAGRVSNGLTYAELMATGLGLPSQGRYVILGPYNNGGAYLPGSVVTYNGQSWNCTQITAGGNIPTVGSAYWTLWVQPGFPPGSLTAFNTALGWDDYAVPGSTWNGLGSIIPNVVKGQVAYFNTDFANTVPTDALIFFEFTGVNDTAQLMENFGGGMLTAADPVLTGIPSFTQPAVGGSVQVLFPSIPTGLAVGIWIWITGGGVYSVSAINSNLVTLVLQAAFWNTSPIAAHNATVPGGNMRWAGAQAMDDIIADYLATVNALFSQGATKIIISNCPDYTNTPFGISPTYNFTVSSISPTVAYWNTALLAAFASLIANQKVFVYDLATIFASILNNPQQYNLANLDAQENPGIQGGLFDETNWLADGLIHPTGATHRIYGKVGTELVVSMYPPSPQISAMASIFNIEPNSGPASWITGSSAYGVPQTPSPLPFPVAVTCNDPRLLLAQTVGRPQLSQPLGTDYLEGTLLPNSNWTSWTNGGGSGSNAGSAAGTLGGHGGIQAGLASVNDGYGQTCNIPVLLIGGAPWISTGPIGSVARVGRYSSAGDQLMWRMGIVDALLLARPANGIFLELTDNGAGVFALKLIQAVASVYTVVATAAYTNGVTNSTAQTFMFVSDYSLRWWSVFASGVCILTKKMPALPFGSSLFLAWQVIKTGYTSAGITYGFADGIWVLNTNQGRK